MRRSRQYLEQQRPDPDLDAFSGFPRRWSAAYDKAQALRYGENPHQKAALYGTLPRPLCPAAGQGT
jgi:phosphoribosylaminoimidazolecarboxamide formyltransferase/IMP cyclohydrolase